MAHPAFVLPVLFSLKGRGIDSCIECHLQMYLFTSNKPREHDHGEQWEAARTNVAQVEKKKVVVANFNESNRPSLHSS